MPLEFSGEFEVGKYYFSDRSKRTYRYDGLEEQWHFFTIVKVSKNDNPRLVGHQTEALKATKAFDHLVEVPQPEIA